MDGVLESLVNYHSYCVGFLMEVGLLTIVVLVCSAFVFLFTYGHMFIVKCYNKLMRHLKKRNETKDERE